MIYLVYGLFSLLLSTGLIPVAIRVGERFGIVDRPSARKIHQRAIPRTGGVSIVLGSLVPLLFILKMDPIFVGFAVGAVCLTFIGVLDDAFDLRPRWKFLGQTIAVVMLVLISGLRVESFGRILPHVDVHLGLFSLPVTVFFLLACINIINLSDGLDGLAGGISLLILSCSAVLAFINQNTVSLVVIICVLGALVGFLRYNVHPAVVFMGDTGSQFLGYSLGFSMILLTQGDTIYSPVLPLFLLGTPVVDTASVILERIMRRESIFSPDKNHLHHKLLNQGFNHSQAVLVIYAVNLLFITVGWNMRFAQDWVALLTYLGFIATGLVVIAVAYRHPDFVNTCRRGLLLALDAFSNDQFPLLSRMTFSRFAWKGFFFMFGLFFVVAPLSTPRVPWVHAATAMLLSVMTFMAKSGSPVFRDRLMRMVFFLGGLYLLDRMAGVGWMFTLLDNRLNIGEVITMGLAMCYVLAIILTPEKLPLDGLDFLLIGVVLFLFLIPDEYRTLVGLHAILAQLLVIGLSVNLIFSRIDRNRRFLQTLLFYSSLAMFVRTLF